MRSFSYMMPVLAAMLLAACRQPPPCDNSPARVHGIIDSIRANRSQHITEKFLTPEDGGIHEYLSASRVQDSIIEYQQVFGSQCTVAFISTGTSLAIYSLKEKMLLRELNFPRRWIGYLHRLTVHDSLLIMSYGIGVYIIRPDLRISPNLLSFAGLDERFRYFPVDSCRISKDNIRVFFSEKQNCRPRLNTDSIGSFSLHITDSLFQFDTLQYWQPPITRPQYVAPQF